MCIVKHTLIFSNVFSDALNKSILSANMDSRLLILTMLI